MARSRWGRRMLSDWVGVDEAARVAKAFARSFFDERGDDFAALTRDTNLWAGQHLAPASWGRWVASLLRAGGGTTTLASVDLPPFEPVIHTDAVGSKTLLSLSEAFGVASEYFWQFASDHPGAGASRQLLAALDGVDESPAHPFWLDWYASVDAVRSRRLPPASAARVSSAESEQSAVAGENYAYFTVVSETMALPEIVAVLGEEADSGWSIGEPLHRPHLVVRLLTSFSRWNRETGLSRSSTTQEQLDVLVEPVARIASALSGRSDLDCVLQIVQCNGHTIGMDGFNLDAAWVSVLAATGASVDVDQYDANRQPLVIRRRRED